jgi:hypothetical protein
VFGRRDRLDGHLDERIPPSFRGAMDPPAEPAHTDAGFAEDKDAPVLFGEPLERLNGRGHRTALGDNLLIEGIIRGEDVDPLRHSRSIACAGYRPHGVDEPARSLAILERSACSAHRDGVALHCDTIDA